MYKLGNALIITFLIFISAWVLLSFHSSGYLFNSDTLQYIAFYRDMFWYDYPLTGWTFSQAPYFFPSISLLSLIYAICHNIEASYLLLIGIELLGLTFLLFMINKIIFPKQAIHTITPLFLLMGYTILLSSQLYVLLYDFLMPFNHLGTTLISILCLYLVLRFWEKPNWLINSILFLLCFLTTVSDTLLITTLTAPLITAMILCWIKAAKPPITPTLTIILSSILALIVVQFLRYHQHIHFDLNDWSTFIASTKPLLQGQYLRFIVPWLICYAIVAMLSGKYLLQSRTRNQVNQSDITSKQRQCLVYYVLLVPPVILAATLITGKFGNLLSSRYFSAFFFLPMYVTVSYAAVKLSLVLKKPMLLCLFIGLALVLSSSAYFQKHRLMFPIALPSPKPPTAACLDKHANNIPTRYGLSTYWRARQISYYNKHQFWINQIDDNNSGAISLWLNNRNWYLWEPNQRNKQPHYSFIIAKSHVALKHLKHVFGQPNSIIDCRAENYHSSDFIMIYNTPASINTLNQNFIQINQHFFKKYGNTP